MDEDQPTLLLGEDVFFDPEGYDPEGYDRQGYNRNGFNREGYDHEGYDRYGYNSEGYDSEGYNSEGYDSEGYDSDGLNDNGYDRNGNYYPVCDDCQERCHDYGMRTVGNDYVCEDCRDNNYSWCESCEEYYSNENASDHSHGAGEGCCDSPVRRFRIRNGAGWLDNDTKVTIALPSGTISDEGLNEIAKVIAREYRNTGKISWYELSADLDVLGDQWQTRTGNYAKRLSSHAYKSQMLKLPPDLLSKVGVIARDHSLPVSMDIDVTRDLNRPADYFYHGESCWWGSYAESRCALKTNGGFAMRSLGKLPGLDWVKESEPTGRAWVLPLREKEGRIVPTFNTETPDAFMVFNGYGALSGYGPARILAHMEGWTYQKQPEFGCDPMYVNSGGYLVAPEAILVKWKGRDMYLRGIYQHSSLHDDERRSA